MKHLVIAIAVVTLISGYAGAAFAETPAVQSQQEPSSAEKEQMRSDIKALGEMFGVEQAPVPAKAADGSAPQKKTVAEVADKALDMASGLVAKVAAAVGKVSPEIWRVMIKQQYAKAIADLVVPWSLFFTVLLVACLLRKRAGQLPTIRDASDDDMTVYFLFIILPTAVCLICLVCGLNCLSDSIKYLVNPEYYAVRDILQMLLNRGQTQ